MVLGMFGVAMIILIGVVAIGAIVYGYHAAQKRREELFQLATHQAMLFEPDPGDIHDRFEGFLPFGKGSSRKSQNLIHGPWNGIEWEVFDYQYVTGSGDDRKTHRYGVMMARLPVSLPMLEIRPEGWLDKVAGLVGFEDINFESEAFSRRFHVKCDSRKVAYDMIHPQMIEYLMKGPPQHWQLRGNRLMLIRKGYFRAGELPGLMDVVKGFIGRIPGYVREDRGITDSRTVPPI